MAILPPKMREENPFFCTVMRGDIGLYENFEKTVKVQANYPESTIKILCSSVCLVAPTNRLVWVWKGNWLGTLEETVALRHSKGVINV